MLKTTILALILSLAPGCGTAPAPKLSNSQLFSVILEQADTSTSSLTMTIKVSGPATQTNVKAAAEAAIAARKNEYRHILIKSYTEDLETSGVPFAVSKLEEGEVTHRFNSLAETQKIPTH
jgi:hypothetical protein